MVEGKGLRVTLFHTHLSSSPEAALQRAPAQPAACSREGPVSEATNQATLPSAGLEQSVCASGLCSGMASSGRRAGQSWVWSHSVSAGV